MRIVCPICSAAYEVRDDQLRSGRTVRCARCGDEWVPLPLSPGAPAPEEAVPEVGAPPAPAAQGQPRPDETPAQPRGTPLTAMQRLASHPASVPRPDMVLRAARAGSLLVLLLLGWGLVSLRADVMEAWPPSIRFYNAIGLGPAQPVPPGR